MRREELRSKRAMKEGTRLSNVYGIREISRVFRVCYVIDLLFRLLLS